MLIRNRLQYSRHLSQPIHPCWSRNRLQNNNVRELHDNLNSSTRNASGVGELFDNSNRTESDRKQFRQIDWYNAKYWPQHWPRTFLDRLDFAEDKKAICKATMRADYAKNDSYSASPRRRQASRKFSRFNEMTREISTPTLSAHFSRQIRRC